ncbi:MAG: flagellar hook-basal body complex protein [Desulfovibrio sp.]|nr:flagellar hook-basal body complex protein [Desulfovibrio sp.]
MTLSASMWTSVSGLLAHGDKMNVVGNNIANVSTIGFKSQRMDFNDYLYIDRGSTSGPTQIGEGVSIYAVLGDFSQGAFESTNSGTDVAIDGNGFFGVRATNSNTIYYTRAGDFYFNQDRVLVNPEDMKVQGLRVDNTKEIAFHSGSGGIHNSKIEGAYVGSGSPTDIVLDSWNCIPQRTTNVTVNNLLINDTEYDKVVDYDYPMSALFRTWDARKTQEVPPQSALSENAYATQSTLKVYDEGGSEHDLTIYFDKVNTPVYDNANPPNQVYKLEGLPAGYQVYEYLVTIPPSEDLRSYGGTYNPVTNILSGETNFYDPSGTGTKKEAGVLMSGVLVFNGSGQLVDMTAYTYGASYDGSANVNKQCDLDPDALTSWQPTKFSNNGLPVVAANFTGLPLANSVGEMAQNAGGPPPYYQSTQNIIEIDFGLVDASGKWVNPATGTSLADLVNVRTLTVADGTNTTTITNAGASTTKSPDPNESSLTATAAGNWYSITQNGSDVEVRTWLAAYTSTIAGATTGYTITGPNPSNTPIIPDPNESTLDSSATGNWYSVTQNGSDVEIRAWTVTTAGAVDAGSSTLIIIPGGTATAAAGSPALGTAINELGSKTPDTLGVVPGSSKLVTYTGATATATPPGTINTDINATPTTTTSNGAVAYSTNAATMADKERQEYATANNGSQFISDVQQDGYGSGVLSGYNIDTNGVIYGRYSNNVTIPLWQMSLYDFRNLQGLRREGGNLYSQTMDSGNPLVGVPGSANFGATQAYNIEQSNVDLSREFVQMITTQRGFQANSKAVTTVDTMLETVIGMKR